jgi:mRNA-degrading endonuclease RelE of RelBE toxin-antitoxin system
VKVAKAYPKMKPEQQQRLQAQMKEWAMLTPEQRRVARENFKTIKKLPPEKRKQVKAQWQEYQQSLVAKPEPAGDAVVPTTTPQ